MTRKSYDERNRTADKRAEARQRRILEEERVNRTSGPEPQWDEILDELEDLDDMLQQVAGRIAQVEQEFTAVLLPDGRVVPGAVRERLRQVRAQLEIAGGFGEQWMGGSPYTLSSSIDEIRELAWGGEDR